MKLDNVKTDYADDSYYVVTLDRRKDDIAARESRSSLDHTTVYFQYWKRCENTSPFQRGSSIALNLPA